MKPPKTNPPSFVNSEIKFKVLKRGCYTNLENPPSYLRSIHREIMGDQHGQIGNVLNYSRMRKVRINPHPTNPLTNAVSPHVCDDQNLSVFVNAKLIPQT